MNQGKIAVSGAPAELKRSIGGDLVTVRDVGQAALDWSPRST